MLLLQLLEDRTTSTSRVKGRLLGDEVVDGVGDGGPEVLNGAGERESVGFRERGLARDGGVAIVDGS